VELARDPRIECSIRIQAANLLDRATQPPKQPQAPRIWVVDNSCPVA